MYTHYLIPASPGVTYADLDCRLFKVPLIDGAETVSTVLNNSKIRFRKLQVILITFGREKIHALEDMHWIKYECYSKISIQKYSRYPAGGL
jgi:hypothetical protein